MQRCPFYVCQFYHLFMSFAAANTKGQKNCTQSQIHTGLPFIQMLGKYLRFCWCESWWLLGLLERCFRLLIWLSPCMVLTSSTLKTKFWLNSAPKLNSREVFHVVLFLVPLRPKVVFTSGFTEECVKTVVECFWSSSSCLRRVWKLSLCEQTEKISKTNW